MNFGKDRMALNKALKLLDKGIRRKFNATTIFDKHGNNYPCLLVFDPDFLFVGESRRGEVWIIRADISKIGAAPLNYPGFVYKVNYKKDSKVKLLDVLDIDKITKSIFVYRYEVDGSKRGFIQLDHNFTIHNFHKFFEYYTLMKSFIPTLVITKDIKK